MSNLRIWEDVRTVPETAKKRIPAGRLKDFTDINPMWRIKKLTELFGPCGVGWYYDITDKRTVDGADGQIVAIVDINLFVKIDGEWSKPIAGTGGSMLVAKEQTGPYTSDECFKMALTDAISVSCKALGFGADVYWEKDSNKYDMPEKPSKTETKPAKTERPDVLTGVQRNQIANACKENNVSGDQLRELLDNMGYADIKLSEIPSTEFQRIIEQISGVALPFNL